MRYSTILALAASPLLVSARPVRTRDDAAIATVFQFASVLNQLEANFYKQAIQKFSDQDFTDAGFTSSQMVSEVLNNIQADEEAHITALEGGLTAFGQNPLTCNFKLDDTLKDVPTFAATARLFEFVGVSAFLGAANLLPNDLVDAAGQILTIEARHSTLLNVFSGQGSALPSAFDIGLTPQEILGIAGGFVDGDCDLGLQGTKPLTVTNAKVNPGDTVTVSGDGIDGTDNLFCNLLQGGDSETKNMPLSQCVVPDKTNGPVVIWITSSSDTLAGDVIARGQQTDKQVAGPAIFFVDSQPETLGQLVRKVSN